jgi:membrane associated rhomboid family serine protease
MDEPASTGQADETAATPALPADVPNAVVSRTASTASLKQRFPILTLLTCAVCISVFIGINQEGQPYSLEALERWGAYSANKIYSGAVWGLLTSVFVHVEIWHIAFNLYWLWVLGSRFERVAGWRRWLGFFLAAAFISSGAQFAFSGETGIGASGVGYALFGLLWITRKQFPTFEKVLDPRTILMFLAWLVACLLLTMSGAWTVGNAAHFAGLLFGAGVGAWVVWPKYKPYLKAGFAILALIATVPLVWAPWSAEWNSWAATRAYARGDFPAALRFYQRSLRLGQDKLWCLHNMALTYHVMGDKAHYEETLKQVRELDEKDAAEVEALIQNEKK